MRTPAHDTAIVLGLAGLAVVGRLSLIAIPNVSLSYLVVFLAGAAYGVRVGASVGLVSRVAVDLMISGLNPILVPMAFVEASMGFFAGLLHRRTNLGQQRPASGFHTRVLLLAIAIVYTLLYSVLADTADWLFFSVFLPNAPSVARTALWATLVLKGLIFMVPAVFFNAAVFPAVVPPILNALRNAGLLPEPASAPLRRLTPVADAALGDAKD